MSSLGSLSEYINYSQKPRPSVEIRLLDEEEVDGGWVLEPDRETLLDLVPSVGITLSF